MFTSQTLS
jgi:hypothetical protein